MRRFKSIRYARRVLSLHGQMSNYFAVSRHRVRACQADAELMFEYVYEAADLVGAAVT